MTPQLQEIKDRLSKIESDTAEARKMLEKAEKEAKSAEPWRPIHNEPYYFVCHDGIKWQCRYDTFIKTFISDAERVKAGNCFRTEAEALEVATQWQFFTELWSVGAESPTSRAFIPMLTFNGHMIQHWVEVCTGARKFPDVESMNAFIEKWGAKPVV